MNEIGSKLCFAVYSASLAMTQTYKSLLAPLGLTYPQYLVMLVLWEHGALTVNEIARHVHQEPGSLSPQLKRMEALGVLVRERNASDERQVVVRLSAAGNALRERTVAVDSAFGKACGLSDDEVGRLHMSLTRLNERLRSE